MKSSMFDVDPTTPMPRRLAAIANLNISPGTWAQRNLTLGSDVSMHNGALRRTQIDSLDIPRGICSWLAQSGAYLKMRGQEGIAVGLRHQLRDFATEHVVDDAGTFPEIVQPREQRLHARLGMLCAKSWEVNNNAATCALRTPQEIKINHKQDMTTNVNLCLTL